MLISILWNVHVITRKRLKTFWQTHPQAESPLREWFRRMSKTRFEDFNHLRQVFPQADYVASVVIFNIAGNKYRLVASLDYETQRVYIKRVLTHAEYDEWNKQGRPL